MFFNMSMAVGYLCTQCRRIGCSKDLSFTLHSVEKAFSVFVALFHQRMLHYFRSFHKTDQGEIKHDNFSRGKGGLNYFVCL
jgi:hypothetical protein